IKRESRMAGALGIYAISFFAASISSDTNIFSSVPCIEQARDIGSLPKAGHVKQLAPKCFENTSLVVGHFVVTSPVVIAGVIFNSSILSSFFSNQGFMP